MQPSENRQIEIDFMYLDIETCSRCKGTANNLTTALQMAEALIDASGAKVTVRKTLVNSEKEAQEMGFVSSPTIRVNGHDIDVDLRESRCEDCTEVCGCGEDITCRVWRYKGQDYDVAPVPILLNAIMSAVYEPRDGDEPVRPVSDTPANLRKFFAAKQQVGAACCGPEKSATCCEPENKPSCCGVTSTAMQPVACAC